MEIYILFIFMFLKYFFKLKKYYFNIFLNKKEFKGIIIIYLFNPISGNKIQ